MRNTLRWLAVFALPVLALMFVGADVAHAHTAVQHLVSIGGIGGIGIAIAGATTGTQTSGYTGLNDMLKQVYTKAFENNIEKESEVADLINQAEGFEIIDGPDGKQVNLGHIFSSGGGVGAMNEDDYLYTPTAPTTKQSSITIKQLIAVVELSGRTLRRVKKGPAAFVTWADEALPRKAQRLAFHKDRMMIGTGTGIIGRYNCTPDGSDAIDSAYGVANLEGVCNLILRDDNIKAAAAAAGTTMRAGTALVASVDYANSAINTTVAGVTNAPTAAADNDYLFLGDANVQGIGTREMMGLEGIIDDGTNVATFQGLARATYPELNAQIIDSSANGFTQALSEEILDVADSQVYERGNLGKPSIVLCNRSGQRSFWKTLKADREINDPRGAFQGGLNRAELKMILGDRIARVRAGRKIPSSRCYGIDPTSMLRFRVGTGRWDDTDGAVFNRVVDGTGRKDAFFAVYVEEEELGCGDPAKNFKITNLAAA